MTYDNSSKELAYRVTNESLEAIVHGLNPQREDSILSVCGSGDQTFALLEKVKRAIVVDYNPKQISYFVKRKSLLKAGEFLEFLNPGERLSGRYLSDLKLRNRYFSEDKLKRIQANLRSPKGVNRITASLFDLSFAREEFSKIYLSNIFSHSLSPETIKLVRDRLKTIAEWLSDRGLIYLSDYDLITQRRFYENEEVLLKPAGLEVNPDLTEEVQKLQKENTGSVTWKPAVLQKVA